MKSFIFLAGMFIFLMPSLLAEEDHGHDHDHDTVKPVPSHGGIILEIRYGVAFIEMLHDMKQGKVTLHILDKERKPLSLAEAPKLNLNFRVDKVVKKKQLVTTAVNPQEGKSSEFIAEDALLKSGVLEGRISIKIGDKTYQVELPEHDDHEGHHHPH